MNREQFTKRLKEVGFVRVSTFFFQHGSLPYSLCTCSNKDWFCYGVTGYTFDELEQFLINQQIIKKPFDAHDYLIEHGFDHLNILACQKGNFAVIIFPTDQYIAINHIGGEKSTYSQWRFEDLSKHACDKAIKLVDFLTELENDRESK